MYHHVHKRVSGFVPSLLTMIVRKTMIGSVIGVGGPKQIRKPMSIYITKVATEGRISFLIHSPVFVFRYRSMRPNMSC